MKNFNITVRVNEELHSQVKEHSKAEGISSAEFMRSAIESRVSANARNESASSKTDPSSEEDDQVQFLRQQLEVSANAVQMGQRIVLELQAEKKALYDEINRQKQLLDQPKPQTFWKKLTAVFD